MATKLRRGIIFTRIRVGEIVKPLPMREKSMCHLPLSYPTTSIKNCYWWLRQLLFLEWGGRTVIPCPTAHSTSNEPHDGRRTTTPSFILPITRYLYGSILFLMIAYSSMRTSSELFILMQGRHSCTVCSPLTHRSFPGFYPRSVSSVDL